MNDILLEARKQMQQEDGYTMVYTDSLGRYNADVDISVFHNIFDNTAHLSSHSINNYPNKKWNYTKNMDLSPIITEMETEGFTCTLTYNGYNEPTIHCNHTATQQLIDKQKEENSRKFENAKHGYIRFGKCPKSGKSYNHRDNIYENGVSCFEALFTKDHDYKLLINSYLEISYLSVSGREAYRIYGERIGTGSDGEPLLRVTKAIKIK